LLPNYQIEKFTFASMKKILLSNWNLIRVLRLGIGIAILVQAIVEKDVLFAIAGLLFSGMAVFNIGCCGAGGCNVLNSKTSEIEKDITYEEVV